MTQPTPTQKNKEEWRELIEKLADIEHQRWSDWQKYLHSKCFRDTQGYGEIIPRDLFVQWERQIKTPYKDLSEKEKDSDREQVMRYLPIIKTLLKTQENDFYKRHERKVKSILINQEILIKTHHTDLIERAEKELKKYKCGKHKRLLSLLQKLSK